MSPFLIAMAILPGILVSFFIYRQDRYESEQHLMLILAFAMGMISTLPAMKMEAFAAEMGIDETINLTHLIFSSFVVVSFSEELVKFVCLLLLFSRSFFNEPMDGIVYAVMIAMGFATVENIFYADRFGLETTLLRAFTAVPAHAVFAVLSGYYVGLAKFDKENKITLLLKGLFLAVLVHGIYDFFILQDYYPWLITMSTLTLAISLYFSIRLIKKHQHVAPLYADIAYSHSAPTKAPLSENHSEISDAIILEMKKKEEEE